MSQCNFCKLKRYKKDAAKNNNKLILKRSIFMNGTCVFEVPKNMIEFPKYIEPNNKLPNGNDTYQNYIKCWMTEIPEKCAC